MTIYKGYYVVTGDGTHSYDVCHTITEQGAIDYTRRYVEDKYGIYLEWHPKDKNRGRIGGAAGIELSIYVKEIQVLDT